LQEQLSRLIPESPNEDAQAERTVQTTCRMVLAAARYGLVRPTCLVESLTLWYLLRQQNISAALRIGVSKTAEKFEAHAWVESGGMALNQAAEPHQHYAAFDSEFCNLQDNRS
jgi:post-segregation antitoxin (ccd killing protein)